jgi:hypothetical protein
MRSANGWSNLVAIVLLIGCAEEPVASVDAGRPDAGTTVLDGGVGACGDSWVLTYAISGTFYITDTTLGMGDADRPLSEGVLKLRVVDDNGAPGDGPARLIAFSHGEKFSVAAFAIEVNTDLLVRAGPDPCGLALGQRGADALTWERCIASASQGVDKNSWTPDDAAEGPGCLGGYTTAGNVACVGAFCSAGGLVEGDNPQAESYDQPLEGFVFNDGWSRFSMPRVELPNRTPSRTWFDLQGVLVDQSLSNIPHCVCEG